MKPNRTQRSIRIRQLNFARQLTREAEKAVRDLDSLYLEPKDRLPFDPGVDHAVTLTTDESGGYPRGRASCVCGVDSGWLPLWDVELRAHWHRRQAEEANASTFDRTLFATLARYKSKPDLARVGLVEVMRRAKRESAQQEIAEAQDSLERRIRAHLSKGRVQVMLTDVRASPVVPLPILDGQQPVLLVVDDRDFAIDLAYERDPVPGGTRVRSATDISTAYWIPRMTPVFAVSEGFIVYARQHLDGHTIVIDHGNKWLSVYHRLEHMFVLPSERKRPHVKVAAGDVLGYLAPCREGPLKSLRFELWKCDAEHDYQQMDPLRYIRRWRHID